MKWALAGVAALALVRLVRRYVLTRTRDPIYIVSRSSMLGNGDLYLAFKRAGVGVTERIPRPAAKAKESEKR